MSISLICSGVGGVSKGVIGVGINGGVVGAEGKRACCSLYFIHVDFNLALYCHVDAGTNDAFFSMTDANESSI
jgi:hypothetical protein